MKYVTILFFICSTSIYAQNSNIYYTNTKYNKYIEYLISKSELVIDHPLHQPYSFGNIIDDLKKNKTKSSISELLIEDLEIFNSSLIFDWYLKNENEYSNNQKHFNFLLKANGIFNYKKINSHVDYSYNTDFFNDTIFFSGIGKLQNKKASRSNIGYFKYNLKNFNFLIGRVNRNFGYINEYSLIKSNNSLSFDEISYNLFNKHIFYIFSATRLEDRFSYDSRISTTEYNWNKRYLSFHRIEINFNDKLKFALSESVLYGGTNQNILAYYLNPISSFFISKMNERNSYEEIDANILGAIEIYYNSQNNTSFYCQFLIDDMDFTKELRSEFPDRVGLVVKMSLADFWITQSNLKLNYKLISNYTYNSFYTFGNYTFYDKSIGYPKNGYNEVAFEYDIFKIKKTILTFGYSFIKEKEQNLQTHYNPELNSFVKEKNHKIELMGTHFFNNNFNTNIKFEFLNIKNFQNIKNQSKSLFNVYLNFDLYI